MPELPEMVRSEERLAVGVARAPYLGVRIGKRIVTETRTVTVEVRREELFYEEHELGGGVPAAAAAADAAAETFVITLHEEHLAIDRVVVPVERVRVTVRTVDGAVDLHATVSHERFALEDVTPNTQGSTQ